MKHIRSIMFALACASVGSAALIPGGVCENGTSDQYNALGSAGCTLNGMTLNAFSVGIGDDLTGTANVIVLSDGFRIEPIGSEQKAVQFGFLLNNFGVPVTLDYLTGMGAYGPGVADNLHVSVGADILGGTTAGVYIPVDLGGGTVEAFYGGDLSSEVDTQAFFTVQVGSFAFSGPGQEPPSITAAEIRFALAPPPEEVPEPASMGLMGLGLGGLFIARKRISAFRTRK